MLSGHMSAPCAGAGKLTPSPPPAPCQPPGDAQLRHHVAAVGRGDGRVPAGAGGPQPRRVRSGLPGRRRARRLRGPGRHWCARNKPAGGVGEVRHASTVAQTLTPWPQAACAHHPFPWVPLHRPHLGLPHGPQRARAGGAREAAAHGGLLAKRLHGESRGRARPTYPGTPFPHPPARYRAAAPPPPPAPVRRWPPAATTTACACGTCAKRRAPTASPRTAPWCRRCGGSRAGATSC